VVGQIADGWWPSLGYVEGGPAGLAEMNKYIDDGAAAAGRDPASVRRLLNVMGRFASTHSGLLVGPPKQWAEELAEMTLNYGITGFILGTDDAAVIERFAAEVAPATRELVAAERSRHAESTDKKAEPHVQARRSGHRI
jgi:alkanesulfonate monooxygenase SsuD/methylene tetrahydromethanopterin reductase-like flavin-dependent oxidoreductase (luciferase family)